MCLLRVWCREGVCGWAGTHPVKVGGGGGDGVILQESGPDASHWYMACLEHPLRTFRIPITGTKTPRGGELQWYLFYGNHVKIAVQKLIIISMINCFFTVRTIIWSFTLGFPISFPFSKQLMTQFQMVTAQCDQRPARGFTKHVLRHLDPLCQGSHHVGSGGRRPY